MTLPLPFHALEDVHIHRPPRSHTRARCICLLILLIPIMIHLYLQGQQLPISSYFLSLGFGAGGGFSGSVSTMAVRDLEAGRWVPRQPPLTEEDLRLMWSGEYARSENVRSEVEMGALSDGELARARERRAVRMVNWAWEGAGAFKRWDWEEWVVRLLRSTGGLILVGDSVTMQFFDFLQYSLPPTFEFESEWLPVHPWAENLAPGTFNLYIPPTHPLATSLIARADVPIERLSRPLISAIRDDTLLPLPQLLELRNSAVQDDRDFLNRVNLTDDNGANGITNVVLAGWRTRVLALLQPISTHENGEHGRWSGESRSVVVVNTGAHWAPESMHGLSEEQLMDFYGSVVDAVLPQLTSLPHTSLLYRPTIPGHPHCDSLTHPLSPSDAQALLSSLRLEDTAWNLFDRYNAIWKQRLGVHDTGRAISLSPNSGGGRGGDTNGVGWLPVWERSVMRPDVHRLAGDCFHMDSPAVFDEWARATWALVKEMDPTW